MSSWPLRVISTELRKILAYRSDFWVNFIGYSLLHLSISRALWQAIFSAQGVESMRGLDLAQLTLYYVLAPVSFKAMMGENIGFLSREIYEGGLNRYLVWPLPPLGFKLLTYLTYSGFYLAQMVLLYLIARFIVVPDPISTTELLRLGCGTGLLLIACVTFFHLMALCEMASFWFDNSWTLGVMLKFGSYFLGGILVPLTFYPPTLQRVVSYLPFAPMVSVPVNFILGHVDAAGAWNGLALLLVWLVVLHLLVRLVWQRGNLRYTGVGM